LVLYGSEDSNVPSHESKIRFDNLHKDNISVKIFEGSGHNLQNPSGRGNRFIRQDALDDITDFIGKVTIST
ncbi:MAG: hypothetical protein ACK2TS_08155, partial [Anaerolineales bacterium]